ncbi:MAG: ABC transporter permease, partial [Alphaproteobacteria bacterium]|nr:ABC transporter permease [Alphaproteobacteria bacterium]
MIRYFTHRAAEAGLLLLVMSFVIYLLLGLMPGDPIDIMASGDPDMSTDDIARLKALYGLDRPITERYYHWLAGALSGDFGFSRLHTRPVLEVLGPRLWNTTVLMGLSFVLALIIAIPLGVIAAVRPRTWVDYAINLFAFAGFSLPSFWLALLLILLFSVTLGWLPAGGVQSVGRTDWADWLLHLIMPITALTLLTMGRIIRFTRASMIEALRQDYIRTAEAKGLSPYGVVVGHAMQNAMIPVVTVLALDF